MATLLWVKTGSGNGLVPGRNKPLPEPMLTKYSSEGNFNENEPDIYIWTCISKVLIQDYSHISQGPLSLNFQVPVL